MLEEREVSTKTKKLRTDLAAMIGGIEVRLKILLLYPVKITSF